MTDLRETVLGIVARLQHRDNAAEANAATDAIMSEIAKARLKVEPLEWEKPEKDGSSAPSCQRVTFGWIGGWAEVHFSEGRAWVWPWMIVSWAAGKVSAKKGGDA